MPASRRTRYRKALASLSIAAVAAATALAHPHVTRRIEVGLTPGKVVVQYFTVPYNEAHLGSLPTDFLWHLGFASVEIDGAVTAGGSKIAPGKYHLLAQQLAEKKWSLALVPQGSGGTIAAIGREALAEKDEAKRKALIEKMTGAAAGKIALATDYVRGGAAPKEHLSITVEDRGHDLGELRQGGKPGEKSLGREFVLHVDFGDLHGSVVFAEPPAG